MSLSGGTARVVGVVKVDDGTKARHSQCESMEEFVSPANAWDRGHAERRV
jgi:hypothetical protein